VAFDCLWENSMKWNNDNSKMHSYVRLRFVCQRLAKRCFWAQSISGERLGMIAVREGLLYELVFTVDLFRRIC
jgi:hypothetical protein